MVGLGQSLTGSGDDDMGEFFMENFFSASAKWHVKAREFLELTMWPQIWPR